MSKDRRGWFRCKPPAGSEHAVLRIGRKEVPLLLLNTSATGLSAQSNEPLEAQIGDCLLLRTVTGWIEVRVARLDSGDATTQLGLERLREIGEHLPFNLLDYVGGPRGAAALALAVVSGALLGVAIVVVASFW